nr:uncharacterized protein LOC113806893 [Penaeus vannamei]
MKASCVFWLIACLVLAAGVVARPGPPSASPEPDSGTPSVPALRDASSEIYLPGSSSDENLDDVVSLDGGLENSVTPSGSEADPVVSNDTLGDSISEFSDFNVSESSGDAAEIHFLKSDSDRPPSNESVDPLSSNEESLSLATLRNETEIFVSTTNESVDPSFAKLPEVNYTQSESQNPSQSQNLTMVYILSFGEKENPASSQEDAQDYLIMNENMEESDSMDKEASQDTSGESLSAQVPESQISFFDHSKGGITTDGASDNLVALFWAPENIVSTHMSRERSVSHNAFPEASGTSYNALQNPSTPQSLPGNPIPFQNVPDDHNSPQIIPVNHVLFLNDQDDHIPSQNLPEYPIQAHDMLSGHALSHSISGGISASNVQINAPIDHEQGNAPDVTVQNLSDHGFSHGTFEDNASHAVHVNVPSNTGGVSVASHVLQAEVPLHSAQVDIASHVPEVGILHHDEQIPDAPSHINGDVISHVNSRDNPSQTIQTSASLNTVSSHAAHADVPSHNTEFDITSHTSQADILFPENQVANAPSHINADIASPISFKENPSHAFQGSVPLNTVGISVSSHDAHADVPSHNTEFDIIPHSPQADIQFHQNRAADTPSHINVDVTSHRPQVISLQSSIVNVPSQITNVDAPSLFTQSGDLSPNAHPNILSRDSIDFPSQITRVEGPPHATQGDVHSQDFLSDVPFHATQTDVHSQNIPVNLPSHHTPLQDDLSSQSAAVDEAPVHSISNVNIPLQSDTAVHNLPHRFSDHDISQHSFSEHDIPSHSPPVSHVPSADFPEHFPSVQNPEHFPSDNIPGSLFHPDNFPQEHEHRHSDFPSNSISDHHGPSPKILIDQFASENVPLNQVPLHGHQIQSASGPVSQVSSHFASVDSPEIISGSLVPHQSDPVDQVNPHGFTESHPSSFNIQEHHASSVNSPSDFVTSFEPQRFSPQVGHSNALSDLNPLQGAALQSHIHTSDGKPDTASVAPHRFDAATHAPSSSTFTHDSFSHTNEQIPRHPSQNVNVVSTPTHHKANHDSLEGNAFLDTASTPTVLQDQSHEGISSFPKLLVKPVPSSNTPSEDIPSHQSLPHSFPPRITHHETRSEPRQHQHIQSDHPQSGQFHQASSRGPSFGSNAPPAVPNTMAFDEEDDSKEEGKPAEYAFTYVAQDENTGHNFGHEETRQGHRTQGSYYVSLPDGRVRKVSYYVEPNSGFVARLSYEGDVSHDRENDEKREHRPGSQFGEQDYPSVPEQPPDVASYQ